MLFIGVVMKSLTVVLSLVFILLLPVVTKASEQVHWAYEGRFGPDYWSELSLDFGACSEGMQQSPINLEDAFETRLAPVVLHWTQTDWELSNNGRNVFAHPENGGYAMIENRRYDLVQFQLRNPSEHYIDGRPFPMEAQFLHQAEDGELAIISVMIDGGGVNRHFESFMANAPVKKNEKQMLKGFDPTPMTTDLGDIFRYNGSLTMPPCTENVMWTVLSDPLVVSDAAVLAFNSLFKLNARPLQPLNRRYVLTD